MSRVQQSTSGGWHYPGVNFAQSQQRPPTTQQPQYYNQPPSSSQYPRPQQAPRSPHPTQYPPLQSYGQPQNYPASSYQHARGHAPMNSNANAQRYPQAAQQHAPPLHRSSQSWDPRAHPQSSSPLNASPQTSYTHHQGNAPIRSPSTAAQYTSQRSNSIFEQRGRPLPSPSNPPSGHVQAVTQSPSRPQSMPPPPVHPRSPQASHFPYTQSHTPAPSSSQIHTRAPSASRSPIPYAPPPQHPRTRSLSPTKPNSYFATPNLNRSPSSAHGALPQNTPSPVVPQHPYSLKSNAAMGAAQGGTVNATASRFVGTTAAHGSTVLPRSSFAYQSHPANTVQSRVDAYQQRQSQQPSTSFQTVSDVGYDSADSQSISSMARSQSPVSTTSGSSLDADDENEFTGPDSPTSPQYGIRDLPKRGLWREGREDPTSPTSPQFGILDLPRTAELQRSRSSVSDHKRMFENLGSRGQQQTLEMPLVRQPQPSRSERQPSWTLPSADLNKHNEPLQPTHQEAGRQYSVPSTPKKQATPVSQNNTPKAQHAYCASAPPAIPPVSPRKAQTGPNSHLSMALRLAARSLEEERGVSAVPPGYRGIGDDIDDSSTEDSPLEVVAPRSSVPVLAFSTVSTHKASVPDRPPYQARSNPSSAMSSPTKPAFFTRASSRPSNPQNYDMSHAVKTPSLSRSLSRSSSSTSTVPTIQTPEDDSSRFRSNKVDIPVINLPDEDSTSSGAPSASIPTINFPGCEDNDIASPKPSVPIILTELASGPTPSIPSPTKSGRSLPQPPSGRAPGPSMSMQSSGSRPRVPGASLVCGSCAQPIFGRIVSAMGTRWHPECFKCCVCSELLEHVSAYERDGRPYCHLDYHERFAPQCYHCKTPIVDERFITLDDPALGKRTYHEQHFFCAECGDPFLAPSQPKPSAGQGKNQGITIHGDGAFDLEDDVGFTVFKGHPYCETCHVRLRAPKCKGCGKSIREGVGYELPNEDDGRRGAVEALGGKWHWECFKCSGCSNPFEEPSFFQRDKKAFCEPCFSILLRNEI